MRKGHVVGFTRQTPHDLEQQRVREMTRDDVADGAPPYGRIDLDSGIAYLDPR